MDTYQINVAKQGMHLFRTNRIHSKEVAQEVARELATLYGKENVTLTCWVAEYGLVENF